MDDTDIQRNVIRALYALTAIELTLTARGEPTDTIKTAISLLHRIQEENLSRLDKERARET